MKPPQMAAEGVHPPPPSFPAWASVTPHGGLGVSPQRGSWKGFQKEMHVAWGWCKRVKDERWLGGREIGAEGLVALHEPQVLLTWKEGCLGPQLGRGTQMSGTVCIMDEEPAEKVSVFSPEGACEWMATPPSPFSAQQPRWSFRI